MLENDPGAQAAVLDALAVVHATRLGLDVKVPAETPAPALVATLSQLVVCLGDEVDLLGGDSAGLLRQLYAAAVPVTDRELEDG
jgi:hypothetical protein